ncbi:MAG: GIY-YIG nuclease family protein [Candidatus Abyssobacteria bacterium SURF_5]|uniref:GIY-YIG nuclease family protein n=1 Tax=Abyssobacteria bacterium (strain SURF_5) TaxID=2093360 RepID=A0A3A4NAI6_ABYX5|nr:MAG: GIY-YIG nuclease family protein [Candidatus Abyssubacteria bacterium SURF_5]
MNKAAPFSLRIFVAGGDPDGLRLVERSNWTGKAIIFPRALYPEVRGRDEFQQTGVYLLLGPRMHGEGEMLYIGEGDPVRPRLDEHFARKDFWTRAVFFVAGPGNLNKAHIEFLESQLVRLAKAAKRMPLENSNSPSEPTLSEADRADMEVFLQNILGILPVLGIHAFEQTTLDLNSKMDKTLLHCAGRGIEATGYDTPKGFLVLSGSFAAMKEVPSLKKYFPNVCEVREDLISNGVLVAQGDKYYFTQDYTFSSPSLASSVVLARSSNGRTDWKDATGTTLKETQESLAAIVPDWDEEK